MASFLLIHGAWHGGWCFERLSAPLEARGHGVAAPTLPSIGGSDRALAGARLEDWAAFAVEQARALPGPVVLLGHSRAGVVISAAAEQAPDAFAGLVYLAAFLVPAGQSMFDVRDAHAPDAAFERGLSPVARGAALAISPDHAEAAFYGNCAPADRQWALAQLVPEPVAPMATRLSLSAARYGRVPRHYIECTLDRVVPLAQQRAMQADMPCATVTTLESDHSPFLSMPDRLAQALHTIAERIDG